MFPAEYTVVSKTTFAPTATDPATERSSCNAISLNDNPPIPYLLLTHSLDTYLSNNYICLNRSRGKGNRSTTGVY